MPPGERQGRFILLGIAPSAGKAERASLVKAKFSDKKRKGGALKCVIRGRGYPYICNV